MWKNPLARFGHTAPAPGIPDPPASGMCQWNCGAAYTHYCNACGKWICDSYTCGLKSGASAVGFPVRVAIAAFFAVALASISGCAKIHLDCPTGATMTATIGGSNVGYSLLALALASKAPAGSFVPNMVTTFPASAPAPAPPHSTVDYSYVPIFGQDTASCGEAPK